MILKGELRSMCSVIVCSSKLWWTGESQN